MTKRLDVVQISLVKATVELLHGFGKLVDDYASTEIEIVTWPAQGWRPMDPNTGNEGGINEGVFQFRWKGDVLHGRNTAVADSYILGWSCYPTDASEEASDLRRSEVYIRHANYHPDGGQLFFPQVRQPFVAPLALPGDDVQPRDFVGFYFDGSTGLYIHPGVWHEAIIPLDSSADFLDKQGKVHARVSCDFDNEFGAHLCCPLEYEHHS